jgi:hypothetical protein
MATLDKREWYNHSFDATPVQRDGAMYGGTHNMSFSGGSGGFDTRQADIERVRREQAQLQEARHQRNLASARGDMGGFNYGMSQRKSTGNRLLDSVNQRADLAMQRTVIPMQQQKQQNRILEMLVNQQISDAQLAQQQAQAEQMQGYRQASLAQNQAQYDRTMQYNQERDLLNAQQQQQAQQAKTNNSMDFSRYNAGNKYFDENYKAIYSPEIAEYLGNNEALRAQARDHFSRTGQPLAMIPSTEKGWFGSDRVVYKPQYDMPAVGQDLEDQEEDEFLRWLEAQ